MTSEKMPLAEAKRLLRELHDAEVARIKAALEAAIPQMAHDLGQNIDQFRAAFEPIIAQQIATMQEMQRLAEGDLEVLAVPELRD